jgi:hypothetical protein
VNPLLQAGVQLHAFLGVFITDQHQEMIPNNFFYARPLAKQMFTYVLSNGATITLPVTTGLVDKSPRFAAFVSSRDHRVLSMYPSIHPLCEKKKEPTSCAMCACL